MFVRLYLAQDENAVLEITRHHAAEIYPDEPFSEDAVREQLRRALTIADPTIFVIEEKGEVLGYLSALIRGFSYRKGISTYQDALFVRPDKRGTRASALLLDEYVRWAKRLGAAKIFFSTVGPQSARSARLIERYGAAIEGYILRAT